MFAKNILCQVTEAKTSKNGKPYQKLLVDQGDMREADFLYMPFDADPLDAGAYFFDCYFYWSRNDQEYRIKFVNPRPAKG